MGTTSQLSNHGILVCFHLLQQLFILYWFSNSTWTKVDIAVDFTITIDFVARLHRWINSAHLRLQPPVIRGAFYLMPFPPFMTAAWPTTGRSAAVVTLTSFQRMAWLPGQPVCSEFSPITHNPKVHTHLTIKIELQVTQCLFQYWFSLFYAWTHFTLLGEMSLAYVRIILNIFNYINLVITKEWLLKNGIYSLMLVFTAYVYFPLTSTIEYVEMKII